MQGVMIVLPTTPRYKEKIGKVSENADPAAGNGDAAKAADSAPSYISPMLLRLIASNAPWELDVFSDFLHKSKTYHKYRERRRSALRLQRDPVEALLATIREYNKVSDAEENDKQGTQQQPQQQQQSHDKRKTSTGSSACNGQRSCSRECAEKHAKECSRSSTKDSNEKCKTFERQHGGEKGRTCTRECRERPARECSSVKGRSCSRDCIEKFAAARECSDAKPRPGSGRSSKQQALPERPLSARDHNRVKETSLPERPRSARDGMASVNHEISGRRFRSKRSIRPVSARDCEWENSLRDGDGNRYLQRFRPASAGAVLATERTKPLWFRQASVKALQALEKNLFTKLNISTEEGDDGSRPCSRSCETEMSSKSRITNEKSSTKKFQEQEDNSCARPFTAPVIRGDRNGKSTASSLQAEETVKEAAKALELPPIQQQRCDLPFAPRSRNLDAFLPPFASPRKRLVTKNEATADIQGVQHAWIDNSITSTEIDFPITKKFVETSLEKRCSTAPSALNTSTKTPPKNEKQRDPSEVKEPVEVEADNFQDYVIVPDSYNKENHSPSTCSSDYEDAEFQTENKAEDAQQHFGNSCFVKLKKTLSGSADKGVSDLFKGVHESLLVSSRLAEVVDLCSKRGQELLRARETMIIEKPPPETARGRWPFKLHRSRHSSKATRRALRAELKWSIFSNGGKMRALNPIYGGRKFFPRIRFVGGEQTEVLSDRKHLKRPATAPADVQRPPAEEPEQEQTTNVTSVVRRTEGIGPWTPTPESNDIRIRNLDSANFMKNYEEKKKRLPLENHKDVQQLVEPFNCKLSELSSLVSAFTKMAPRPLTGL